jgi:antitoxin component YwqK of YwqJK toxin-antitoxin module
MQVFFMLVCVYNGFRFVNFQNKIIYFELFLKNIMRKIILLLLVLISFEGYSQINQTDSRGLRQGRWERNYTNGKPMYQGSFENGKPVGEWIRYHEGGQVKARIKYTPGSDSAFAQLYEEGGKKIAEGVFVDEKREGQWTFFAGDVKISEEEYRGGIKHGVSRRFYPSGEVLEESEWQNGQQEGNYRVFFTGGNPYLQCKFSNGNRNGLCLSYFQNGRVEMEAYYNNNLRDREWKYYDENGKLLYTLKYDNGNLLNPEVRDSIDNLQNSELEKKENIADPEKFMQDPSEYMMQMQKFR